MDNKLRGEIMKKEISRLLKLRDDATSPQSKSHVTRKIYALFEV